MTDFMLFLKHCSDEQVIGVYERERAAKRYYYARLAREEAKLRGLWHG